MHHIKWWVRDDEVEEDEDEEEDSDEVESDTPKKRKMKRPVAAGMKRPAGKKPEPSKDPCHYNGGRIYWSKATKKLRVYARSSDRNDKRKACDGSKKELKTCYDWACKLIDDDERPM